MNTLPKVIVVVGPTASGKSDFAVQIARDLSRVGRGSEIISADSRQIYKGLDIGTGKITKKEMKGVPHYMLDICELTSGFSVSEYKRLAQPILDDIIARDKTPIICGGTGQYIDALIFNTSAPAVPPNKKLRDELKEKSTEELYSELLKYDKRRAETIDKYNRPRLIRALEIVCAVGKVPTQKIPNLKYKTTIYIMSPTREILRERISKRLNSRLKVGMIDEVKTILEKGYNSVEMKKFGLEYVTIAKYLEGEFGKVDPTSQKATSWQRMEQEIITKSMQYAKRQETWNKKYTRDYPSITTKIKVE